MEPYDDGLKNFEARAAEESFRSSAKARAI